MGFDYGYHHLYSFRRSCIELVSGILNMLIVFGLAILPILLQM